MANRNKQPAAQHNAHVLAHAAQPAAPAPAPVAAAPAAPAKGAATAARWFKPKFASNPFAGMGVAQAKAVVLAMPHNTVITCNVNHNPKGGASAPVFALYFGPQPQQGATTTLGALLAAGQAKQLTPAVMAGHIVWDATRNFCSLTPPQG